MIRYKLYRKVKGQKFGSDFSAVPVVKETDIVNKIMPKESEIFETNHLYFVELSVQDVYAG